MLASCFVLNKQPTFGTGADSRTGGHSYDNFNGARLQDSDSWILSGAADIPAVGLSTS